MTQFQSLKVELDERSRTLALPPRTTPSDAIVSQLLAKSEYRFETPTGERFHFTYSASGLQMGERFRIKVFRNQQLAGRMDTVLEYGETEQKEFVCNAVVSYAFGCHRRDDGTISYTTSRGRPALWVDPLVRAEFRGTGTTLLGLAARIAKDYGARQMLLSHPAELAIPFYRKLGLRGETVDEGGHKELQFVVDLQHDMDRVAVGIVRRAS